MARVGVGDRARRVPLVPAPARRGARTTCASATPPSRRPSRAGLQRPPGDRADAGLGGHATGRPGRRAARPGHRAGVRGRARRPLRPGGSFWGEHPELPRLPIRAWQVLNEPNTRGSGPRRRTRRATSPLLRAAAAGMRAADPGATIVLAGLPNRAGSRCASCTRSARAACSTSSPCTLHAAGGGRAPARAVRAPGHGEERRRRPPGVDHRAELAGGGGQGAPAAGSGSR